MAHWYYAGTMVVLYWFHTLVLQCSANVVPMQYRRNTTRYQCCAHLRSRSAARVHCQRSTNVVPRQYQGNANAEARLVRIRPKGHHRGASFPSLRTSRRSRAPYSPTSGSPRDLTVKVIPKAPRPLLCRTMRCPALCCPLLLCCARACAAHALCGAAAQCCASACEENECRRARACLLAARRNLRHRLGVRLALRQLEREAQLSLFEAPRRDARGNTAEDESP